MTPQSVCAREQNRQVPLMWCRPSVGRQREILDELTRVRGTLQSLERRADAERVHEAIGRRRRVKAQLIIAVIASVTGFGLLLYALSPSPATNDPGRIAVAVSGSDAGGEVSVSADFSAAVGSSGAFTVSLTRSKPAEAVGTDTSVTFLFCGAVRRGLQVWELNRLPSTPLRPLPNAPVEYDSVLGARDDCSYTTVKWIGLQVLLRGTADVRTVTVAGKRVQYAFPGIVTLPLTQALDGDEVRPLRRGTTVTAQLRNVPHELEEINAAPQLSSRGTFSWKSTFGTENEFPPMVYTVSGTLSGRENLAEASLFAAGIAGGLAVTAALAAAETLFAGRRRRHSGQ